jgi:putative membrane protein
VTVGLSYAHGVRRLRRRGRAVPRWQLACFAAGLALFGVALSEPMDAWGERLVVGHMAQHLLMADLAAPLLLAGLRWPMHLFALPRPVLVLIARRRWLRRPLTTLVRPLVAIPLYVVVLYFWHLTPLFEAAATDELVHGLQHQSFVLISIMVWWPALEPHRRRLRGELWKIGHVLAARVGGMFLAMGMVAARSPWYDGAYGERARSYGLSPVDDQQLAGGLMLSLDFFVVLFVLGFFFWRAAVDHDRDGPEASYER